MAGKILFIGHDASRTGAPIHLLHILKWLKAHTKVSFEVLLRNGGELQAEFEALSPVHLISSPTSVARQRTDRVLRRLTGHDFIGSTRLKRLKEKLGGGRFDLVYCNTATNGDLLELLSDVVQCPAICHVHELEFWLRYQTDQTTLPLLYKHTQQYIAVSQAVKKNLMENHGIAEANIDVVYGFISPPEEENIDRNIEQRLREELGISPQTLIVGACGTTDWRKGPDLFVQVANAVNQRRIDSPVCFVWMGGEKEGLRLGELLQDVKKVGLEEKVKFIGSQSRPLDYFKLFDVFALVSREDPFPLVNLEAGFSGCPIVCFDQAGGSAEFVEDDCGFVVPYLDIDAMAAKICELLTSTDLRHRMGKNAAKKVRERHIVSVGAPKIYAVIKQFMPNNRESS